MSGWRFTLFAALFLPVFSASAADIKPALSVDLPEIRIAEGDAGHGWYMRGDLGYNAAVSTDPARYRNFNPAGGTYSDVTFDSYRFGNGVTASAGVGYQFNEWLRTDITGDYFGSSWKASSKSSSRCSAAQPAGTTCANAYSTGYTAMGLMANAYVDLGTIIGFTPYVGAGVGAYNVDWGSAKDVATCVNGAGACLASDAGTTYAKGTSDWRFAYDLTAGFSYEISPKTMLDVSYRYSRIAGGSALKFSDADIAAGAQGSKATDGVLDRHEIRAGIRILLW